MASDMSADDKKIVFRTAALSLFALLISGAIAWAVFVRPQAEDEMAVPSTIEVSPEEASLASDVALRAVEKLGNFGVIPEQVSPESLINLESLVWSAPESSNSVFVSRSDAYMSARDDIFAESPSWFSQEETLNWSYAMETGTLSTFRISNIEASYGETGGYVDFAEQRIPSFVVNISFDSEQTRRIATSNDVGWDGSYRVDSKQFTENNVAFTLVKVSEGWKIYSIDPEDNDFLLASWENPNTEDFDSTQFDFTEIETIMARIENTPEYDQEIAG